MTIKNIDDLKNIQIVCRNQNQVKDCVNYLKQLGYTFEDRYGNETDIIIFFSDIGKEIFLTYQIYKNLYIEFYNKQLVKTLQKFIKQKEEQEKEKQEKIKDIEVASDGRITKINNHNSQQKIYTISGTETDLYHLSFFNKMIDLSLLYATKEARDRAMFKLEIETQLKNIAERLNKGQKIDWKNKNQTKYFIHYDYNDKKLDWYIGYCSKNQGVIYSLDRNFLEVAKQEVGENDLIKYFKEDFN